jgi:DNA-directed RNA polymerase subunit RPC12/RpoP
MKHAQERATLGGVGIFERPCDYCGARFRVLATRSAEGGQPHEYACPACGKHYEIESVGSPRVRLLQARTDGKDDRYQETMF